MYPNDTTNKIPYGYCQCGCGQLAPIATQTDKKNGRIQGQPTRYLKGHHTQKHSDLDGPNPSGLCMCGCGQPAPIAERTSPERGRIKGQPMRFIHGHFKSENRYESLAAHFWTYCIRGNPDECWDWQASLTPMGYGHFSHGGKKYVAHRTSWELHFGPIPKGLSVLHKCDRRCCNNPAHLFLGTQIDNLADMRQKKRHAYGTKNGHAKLTPEKVREVRQLRAIGIYIVDLANKYNVSRATIRSVLNGKTWTHVK